MALDSFVFGQVPYDIAAARAWLATEFARLSAYLEASDATTARTDKANTFDSNQVLDFATLSIRTVKGDGAGVGGWARGIQFLDSSDAIYGGLGSLGNDSAETYQYWGAGTTPWTGTVRLYPDGTLRQSATSHYHHDESGVVDTDATLSGTWVDYGAGYRDAGYYKAADGVVHLRGLIKSGAIPSTAFTLPNGCRPSGYAIFDCATSGGVSCQVRVDSAGLVEVISGATAWVSLEGVSFYADGS